MLEKNFIAKYKASWEKRARHQEAENEELRKAAIEVSVKLKDILVNDYHVKKVILFGSILQAGDFNGRSDIDIAVEGLAKDIYFKALGRLMFATDFEVDLKPIEDVDELMAERIKRGRVIYEKGKDPGSRCRDKA